MVWLLEGRLTNEIKQRQFMHYMMQHVINVKCCDLSLKELFAQNLYGNMHSKAILYTTLL